MSVCVRKRERKREREREKERERERERETEEQHKYISVSVVEGCLFVRVPHSIIHPTYMTPTCYGASYPA